MHSERDNPPNPHLPTADPSTSPDTGNDQSVAHHQRPLEDGLRRVSKSFGESDLSGGAATATSNIASSIASRPIEPEADAATLTTTSQVPATGKRESATSNLTMGSSPKDHAIDQNTKLPHSINEFTVEPAAAAPFANGYHFPPKHTFAHSTKLGAVAFWKYFTTPLGFCVTVYMLNVIAWGGMLFLLLCNAAPAMCYPTCNDINSPRRIWLEWSCQILNALFCVTGFGLAPWRFRDLYYIMQWRLQKNETALRRLAGINRGWFRLPGSESLPVLLGPENVAGYPEAATSISIPLPINKIPNAPLTGVRAPASKIWRLDFTIWMMVWNTFFQICLATFMWAMNRYTRPSWATGLFVGLGMVSAAVGGLMMFFDGKHVKSIEGVPVSQEDLVRLEKDRELGIWHYNNMKAEDPEKKKKQDRPDE